MSISFSGLIFVLLNAPPSQLDLNGLILAGVGAFIMACMLITSEKCLANHDNQVVLFHALVMVLVIVLIASLTIISLEWPAGLTGWLIFSASTIFYVIATFTLFQAVSLIGPLRTAIIDNTAPVWAILFGYFILSQSLSLKQIIGAIIVIVSVMLLQIIHNRKAGVTH